MDSKISREQKIDVLKQVMDGKDIDSIIPKVTYSIPSWVVNEHDSDIEKLKSIYGKVIYRDGKFYVLNKSEKQIPEWFPNE